MNDRTRIAGDILAKMLGGVVLMTVDPDVNARDLQEGIAFLPKLALDMTDELLDRIKDTPDPREEKCRI